MKQFTSTVLAAMVLSQSAQGSLLKRLGINIPIGGQTETQVMTGPMSTVMLSTFTMEPTTTSSWTTGPQITTPPSNDESFLGPPNGNGNGNKHCDWLETTTAPRMAMVVCAKRFACMKPKRTCSDGEHTGPPTAWTEISSCTATVHYKAGCGGCATCAMSTFDPATWMTINTDAGSSTSSASSATTTSDPGATFGNLGINPALTQADSPSSTQQGGATKTSSSSSDTSTPTVQQATGPDA